MSVSEKPQVYYYFKSGLLVDFDEIGYRPTPAELQEMINHALHLNGVRVIVLQEAEKL